MSGRVFGLSRLAACLLFIFCIFGCQKMEDDTSLLLSLAREEVSHDTRSIYVRISSDSDWTLEVENTPDWFVSLSDTKGSGSKNSIVLNIEENEEEVPRFLTLVAKAGNLTKTAILSQRGHVVSGNIDWMEVPAVPDVDGRDFFYHRMTIDGSSVRNFSYYFDYHHLVSLWVAYPLCKGWKDDNNLKRTDAWAVDPNMPKERQPVLTGGYKDIGYGWFARGHQCASADRLQNLDANKQTFYGTNMTPQINDNFNSGIWADLEKKVRSWASNSDTLYVVTGCVLDGYTKFVADNAGKKVTVPTGYYKAVLRYSKNSTIGHSDYMALAVFLEHKAYSSKSITKANLMSVDDLEKKIGFDLFPNLISVVGEGEASVIEAENPSTISWWGIK